MAVILWDVTWVEPEIWYAQLPSFIAAAAVLLTDPDGRVLFVRTNYRDYWSWPGGMLDADEAPHKAAAREIREEVGLDVAIGALLVLDWMPASGRRPKPLAHFIFDGGTVDPGLARIVDHHEIVEIGWFPPQEATALVRSGTGHRLTNALVARTTGRTVYSRV